MIPGTYKMKCVEAQLNQKENGREYIGAILEVVDGDCATDRITAFLWWTEKTEERTRKDLKWLGWDGGVRSVSDDTGERVILTGCKNEFAVGINEEEYEGKKRLKVGWIGQPPAGIPVRDRLTMAQAKDFLSRLKGSSQRNGSDDADIPF